MSKAPCLNCPNRTLGCHSTCKEYIEFAKKREEQRNSRFFSNYSNNILRSMKRDGCEKQRKRHGR